MSQQQKLPPMATLYSFYQGLPEEKQRELGKITSFQGIQKTAALYWADQKSGPKAPRKERQAQNYHVLVMWGDGTYANLGTAMSAGAGRAEGPKTRLETLGEALIMERAQEGDGVVGVVLSVVAIPSSADAFKGSYSEFLSSTEVSSEVDASGIEVEPVEETEASSEELPDLSDEVAAE